MIAFVERQLKRRMDCKLVGINERTYGVFICGRELTTCETLIRAEEHERREEKESDWDERCAVFQGKVFLYRISKIMPNMRPMGARGANSAMHLSLKGNRIGQS